MKTTTTTTPTPSPTAISKVIKKTKENPKCPINSPNTKLSPSTKNFITHKNKTFQIISPPSTPKVIHRSEAELHPTTFVQADTGSFKQVVQFLTGSYSSTPISKPDQEPPFVLSPEKVVHRKQAFKLHEGRNSGNLKCSNLVINTPMSPSSVNIPKYDNVSPMTPLSKDVFGNVSSCGSSLCEEEDRATAEKGFFLHPSPTARDVKPRLLPLFPVSSPRGFSPTT